MLGMQQMGRRSAAGRGFTLVELLVVVVIIVLLIGLLIPALSGARNSARRATTQSLMQSVSTGIAQFRADKGRMPGYFNQEQLGQQSNANDRGLTTMENAIIELAGGLLPSDAPAPTGQDAAIRLSTGGSTFVNVDTALIGASDGPGYLNLPGDVLKVAKGQWNGSSPQDGMERMPDIIDPFGQPLLLWIKNPAAGTGSAFAAEAAPPEGSPASAARAQFYWAANAGMLRAEQLGNLQPRSQAFASVLGKPVTGAEHNTAQDRVDSLVALLGHPDLPKTDSTAQYGEPSAPLGDAVIHSAGIDAVFLSNRDGQYKRAAYRLPRNNAAAAAESKELSRFDDLVLPAG